MDFAGQRFVVRVDSLSSVLDKSEARAVALRVLEEWMQRPYDELRDFIDQKERLQIRAASRKRYTVEVEAFWSHSPTTEQPDPDIRIVVAADDGGLSAFVPLCVSDVVSSPRPVFSAGASMTSGARA